jgi:putative RecB family exonuclease
VDVSGLYSHSRLSSFENCPKQFHFRYVLKVPRAMESVEAFLGKRVHEVLERLYRFVGQGLVPPLEKVVQRYHALWDEHFDPERVQVVREETPLSYYRSLGERCVRRYYVRHYPFDADETLSLEQRVVFDLDASGAYRIQGFIDRVALARDGAVEIHDYKTGKRVPSQKRLDEDRQLALYQLGLEREYGPERPMRLIWHYLSLGVVRTSTRNAEQLTALRERTRTAIDRIRSEREFPPRPSGLCRWCEYRALCPTWAEEGAQPTRAVAVARAAPSTRTRARRAPSPPARHEQLRLL